MANSRGPKPHLWKTGPDPVVHLKHIAWHRQRAQANHRGETWTLTFEQWLDCWGEKFDLRGRDADSLCMTRADWEGDWDEHNVELVIRREHFRRQGHARKYGTYP